MASDLLTLNDFLAASGQTNLDASETSRAQWAIGTASAAIRQYLDRDLTLNSDAVQAPRTFRYYGHRMLEIDDCTDIQTVATAVTPWTPSTRTLDAREWIAGQSSANLPVKDCLELLTILPFGMNPAMGFQWNEDVYAAQYGVRSRPLELTVTATWGWAAIPQDIKQAAVWVIGEVLAEVLPWTTESIAGYSHTLGERAAALVPQTAVSVRAQSLLDPYVRINI
jgi:hypothetical protein